MKKSTKWLLKGLGVLGLSLALTACGSKDSSKKEEGSKESKELSVALWAYDGNPEWKAMIDAFKKDNPDVKVKIVDIAADQYENKVTTMLSSGDKTDVLAMKNVGSYVNYAVKGQLEDLTDFEKNLSAKDKENYKGSLESYAMKDGKIYALPYRKEIWMLYYNQDLFKKAGVEMPKDMTWEDYEELSKKLTSGTGDDKVYGSFLYTWLPIVQATAGNQTGSDSLGGKYGFMKDYYDRFLRIQKAGDALDYATIKTTKTTYTSAFETQKAAMMIMGAFNTGKLLNSQNEGKINFKWSVAPLPQRNKGENISFGGPTGFAVSKHAENKELAKKFVEFCAGEKGAKAVAGVGMTTAYQSEDVMKTLFSLKGMPQDELAKKAYNPEKTGFEMAARPETAEVTQILTEEHDLIMVGDETVDKGIANMEKRVASEVEHH